MSFKRTHPPYQPGTVGPPRIRAEDVLTVERAMCERYLGHASAIDLAKALVRRVATFPQRAFATADSWSRARELDHEIGVLRELVSQCAAERKRLGDKAYWENVLADNERGALHDMAREYLYGTTGVN